jgi:hypothetical protein
MIVNYDQLAAEVADVLVASAPVGIRVRVRGMSVVASPDFEAYAEGLVDSPRCALCGLSPCACPSFGTPEYFALIDARHGP